MNCSDVRPLLDLLSDCELEAKDSVMVNAHLESCSDCQNEWQQIEQLQSIFKQARENTKVPPTLLENVDQALLKEEKLHSGALSSSQIIARRYLFVAASPFILAIIASLFVLIKHPTLDLRGREAISNVGPLLRAQFDRIKTADLVADAKTATLVYSKPDLDRLALNLGWDLKYVSLPGWKMQTAQKLQNQPVAIARFGFTKASASGEQSLWCYQAPIYAFSSRGEPVTYENIAGKNVAFGRRGALSYAVWSQNDRDYLFVSDVPEPELKKLVAGT